MGCSCNTISARPDSEQVCESSDLDGSLMLSVFPVCRFDEEYESVAEGDFALQSISRRPAKTQSRLLVAQSKEVLKILRNQTEKGQDGVKGTGMGCDRYCNGL
jgi:hypothetical protein